MTKSSSLKLNKYLIFLHASPSRKDHNSLVEESIKVNYGNVNFVGEHAT